MIFFLLGAKVTPWKRKRKNRSKTKQTQRKVRTPAKRSSFKQQKNKSGTKEKSCSSTKHRNVTSYQPNACYLRTIEENPSTTTTNTPSHNIQCIQDFEEQMKTIKHKKCVMCLSVAMILEGKIMPSRGGFVCKDCIKLKPGETPPFLPIWTDANTEDIHYDIPPELQGLSEGEKLLIQIISPYVPLQHLTKGSFW